MKNIKIFNISHDRVITTQGVLAEGFFERLKGLLGRQELKKCEALCIRPCKSVHTFFMKFSIDVVFVDGENRVIDIIECMRPSKISNYYKNAEYVLELPAFEARSIMNIGDRINII